jgi:hypothetical protein
MFNLLPIPVLYSRASQFYFSLNLCFFFSVEQAAIELGSLAAADFVNVNMCLFRLCKSSKCCLISFVSTDINYIQSVLYISMLHLFLNYYHR